MLILLIGFISEIRAMDVNLALFQQQKIRRHWDEQEEKWYFSVIDIVGALSESERPRKYRSDLKSKLKSEWSEVSEKIGQLKMIASDGKKYLTDVADVETILRLIQSIPSPNAEPFKLWLAKVGYERMQETIDPAMSIDRARENWKKLWRSEKWIQQRMMGQETRNKLTDYRKTHDIKGQNEYAILTNIIHEEWTWMSVQEHKELKNLKNQNLRDHMSEAELIFTALAELSTRQIAESTNATGMEENQVASKKWGSIAKQARKELEHQTGQSVITGENFLPPKKSKL